MQILHGNHRTWCEENFPFIVPKKCETCPKSTQTMINGPMNVTF